jgi:ligand-binding SRPBCC domain-containing protein
MHIRITTHVRQPYSEVFARFNRELFVKLTPAFPTVHLHRFDGCAVGDEVHLELALFGIRQQWISIITDAGEIKNHEHYANELYFVDEGKVLPFFLASWKHRHRIMQSHADNGAVIIDDISFHAPYKLSAFVYPALYAQFAARRAVYQEYFR